MMHARHELCRQYAFAVPTRQAIAAIVRLSPLVELGAGTGYWAALLTSAGAKIQAYDKAPGINHPRNNYKFSRTHSTVLQGSESILEKLNPDHNLFLCWPNYSTDFAYNCLRKFAGCNFAYIGEARGGCTGNDKFFDLLAQQWSATKVVTLPQWPGINDTLTIYTRNPK